ncbi:MAG: response regulator receiver protein [Rhodospirillales bacterium]|nr:response regulator receiver protein [Rhodospirillales bacterium]
MERDNHNKAIVVIVVEDDPMVRMAAVGAFQDAGFEVLEGKNAAAAIVIFNSQGDRVQALFTDVEMPGAMNGLMLARQIHQDWPRICVMVTSGQINPGIEEMPENSRFFKKPYDLKDVVAHIRARAATP